MGAAESKWHGAAQERKQGNKKGSSQNVTRGAKYYVEGKD
jgi:hypothetical protein